MNSQSIIRIKDNDFELFIPESEIIPAIRRVAHRMNQELQGQLPLFICVLNGAFMFASDLLKCIDIPCEITFIRLKSYDGVNPGEKVKEIYALTEKIEGRNVVILEDIIDTGHTITFLLNRMKEEHPESVKVATFLFKPDALKKEIKPDYVALEIPNDFIVGYGLDYDGEGRNFRNIYKIKY